MPFKQTLNWFQCLTRYNQQTQKCSLFATIQVNNMLWDKLKTIQTNEYVQ